MTQQIVILGGGTGGTLTASRQLHRGIAYQQCAVDHVDIEANQVHLADGIALAYDVLVVATGAVLVPEETEGLTGPGWMDKMFTFYTPEGAAALEAALATFDGGRVVVNVVDMPIKCPVAPLEFCFLVDWYFRERGIRDQVRLSYVTPLDGAFTKPVAARQLAGMLADKGVELVTEFNTGQGDGPGGRLVAYTAAKSPSTWPGPAPGVRHAGVERGRGGGRRHRRHRRQVHCLGRLRVRLAHRDRRFAGGGVGADRRL